MGGGVCVCGCAVCVSLRWLIGFILFRLQCCECGVTMETPYPNTASHNYTDIPHFVRTPLKLLPWKRIRIHTCVFPVWVYTHLVFLLMLTVTLAQWRRGKSELSYYSHWKVILLSSKVIQTKIMGRASQDEQNGADFSSVI